MSERREEGLCFNCDQKWLTQHRCGGRAFFMIADEEGDDVDLSQLETILVNESPPAQLSLHALAGSQATDTFHVALNETLHPKSS